MNLKNMFAGIVFAVLRLRGWHRWNNQAHKNKFHLRTITKRTIKKYYDNKYIYTQALHNYIAA
jgi:hypothetical protein